MKTKTAMQELVAWMKQPDFGYFESELDDKIQELLAKERQQIIEARLSVTGLNHASPTDDNSLQDAENYFTQKYEQH